MGDKRISMSTYQWSHFAAIMADVIIFSIIAFLAFKLRHIGSVSSKNKTYNNSISRVRYISFWIFWISIITAIVTLFGLWPVFKDYDTITIN